MTGSLSCHFYYLNIPNGLPKGKNVFPKCSFSTDAPEP